MTTHDTRSQLLAEIAANPEDDTLRLAFADWLDEHGDAADRDRAEFIRVQCELGVWSGRGHPRETELLSAHSEWSRCRCPRCNGRKGRLAKINGGYDDEWIDCGTCGGTGDLFLRHVDDRTHATEPRTVTFARGFVDGVTCTLAEAFAPDGTPTPWAVEVVKQTPVVRFSMTDQTPIHRDSAKNGPFGSGLVWDWSSAHVPYFLIREMAASHPDNVANTPGVDVWWVEFSTESEARDALALAAGRLVRRHAHKERT